MIWPAPGAVIATAPLAGVPSQVVVAAAPGRRGQRLYVVDAEPGPEGDYAAGGRWRLLGLDPLSLDVESEFALGFLPNRLVIAPDGDYAYALAQPNHAVRQIDLAHGAQRVVVATLPGTGLGLAVTRLPCDRGREARAGAGGARAGGVAPRRRTRGMKAMTGMQ